MEESQAKYHHLVPKVYMSAWEYKNGTLNVEFVKEPGKIVPRKKDNIAGISNFYSVKAGMPLCTQEDTDKFFKPLSPYIIEYNGEIIQDTLTMNDSYENFDSWNITRTDGTPVSKKRLKNDIEEIKIRDIESNWSVKYENKWSSVVSRIENEILNSKDESIEAIEREFLMMFYTALDWRGFTSNSQFEELYNSISELVQLDQIDIPKKERILPSLKTAADEMRHYLLLKFYRQYFNDTGVIYQNAMAHLQYTTFHFLVSDGSKKFCTSDTPAFMCTHPNGKNAGILPITPKILMIQCKCTDYNGRYFISHIEDDEVTHYNQAIRSNASEFVIFPNN